MPTGLDGSTWIKRVAEGKNVNIKETQSKSSILKDCLEN
jgi:hypothetical protein